MRFIAAAGVALLVLFAPPTAAFAIECPEPQEKASPGVLEETRQQAQELAAVFGSDDLRNRIGVVTRDLLARHPDADPTMLANYMVSGFCRAVAQDDGLSDSEKDQAVTQFSEQVWTIISAETQ